MKLPSLKIGDLTATLPIVLGGMGVGISGPRLAAAIAKEGGIGVISGVGIGFSEPNYFANQVEIDKQALARKIKQARELAPAGILGVNFLVAMNNYAEMVKTAVAEGIDIIISGAGLPTKLPELVAGSKTMIAPIVSSGKAAKLITKYWSKHYNRLPDMVIVEGTMAGGHLGFKEDVLLGENKPLLKDLVSDVIQALKPFSEQYNVKIPVIAAGGIFTGADIVEHLQAGADAVQMSTRFVATAECDAAEAFKEAYIDCKEEDITIIKSPVGMPGRAINNKFIQQITDSKEKITRCYRCLHGCNPATAPYCISKALINAVKGNMDEGLIFVGSNAYRVNKMSTVPEVIVQLKQEIDLAWGASK